MKKAIVPTVLAACAAVVFCACAAAVEADGGNAAAQTTPKSYTIAYVEQTPDWETIPSADIDTQQWLDPVDITAHAQLCYSADALFVRMWAEEENIRATYPKSDVLGHTYEDSCLEFFIAPVSGDGRYLNFEYNPNGCVCVQIGTGREDRIRMAFEEDIFEAAPRRTEDGWEITYRIPFSFLRTLYPDFKAETGMQIAGNFYKCGNLTEQKHYISWNPIASETPDFHRPEDFGVFVFG